jgi:pimeloyl-ACP methyl ester carboxylesterase
VPVLVDAAFRVIRYDVRGYGRSSRLTGEPYSHVRDLEALLDFLEVPLTSWSAARWVARSRSTSRWSIPTA